MVLHRVIRLGNQRALMYLVYLIYLNVSDCFRYLSEEVKK